MLKHATTVAGTRVTGDRLHEEQRLNDVPNVRGAAHQFTIVVYGDYEFVEADPRGAEGSGVQKEHLAHPEGEWLPQWHDVLHVAGCNGAKEVTRNGRKVVDMTGTYASIVSKGGDVIRHNDNRIPEEFRNYVGRWPVKTNRGHPGRFHAFYTTQPRRFGRDVKPVADHDWICRFKRALVPNIVPAMDRQQLNEALHQISMRLQDRYEAMVAGKLSSEGYHRYADAENARAERMRAAWDRQFGKAEAQAIASAPAMAGQRLIDESEPDPEPPASPLGRKRGKK